MEDIFLEEVLQYPKVEQLGKNHLAIHINKKDKRFYKLYKNKSYYHNRLLIELYKRQTKIKNTQFPIGRILDNDNKCSGSNQLYFNEYQLLLDVCSSTDLQYKLTLLENLLKKLEELHKNNIYHLDLNNQNILYKNEDIQIIDWDDVYTYISDGLNPKLEQTQLKLYEEIVLETILAIGQHPIQDLRNYFFEQNKFLQEKYESYMYTYTFDTTFYLLDFLDKNEKKINIINRKVGKICKKKF